MQRQLRHLCIVELKKMRTYVELIDSGYNSLIERFGIYYPEMETILFEVLAKTNIDQNLLNEDNIEKLVCHYKLECSHYIKHINEMSVYEIEAFIWYIVMRLDIIRGLFPGLKNGDPLNINSRLDAFETQMWEIINKYYHV